MYASSVETDIPESPGEGPNAGLRVLFYTRVVRDEAETKKAGVPKHKSVEYVKISIPADKSIEYDRPVKDQDRREYARLYRAFLENRNQDEASGFPLKSWAGVTPELAEDWAAQKIFTVEQLAAVTDGNLPNLGPTARKFRDKAIEFLKFTSKAAPVARLQEELDAERKRASGMEQRIAELEKALLQKG